MFHIIKQAIGWHFFSLTTLLHMTIRGIIVYYFGISIARFNKKLLGIRTPFNFILFVMLGSIFASAIIDEEIFLPLLITTLLLFLINGLMTLLSFYSPFIELFVKGKDSVIIKNGKIQWQIMQQNLITKRELLNELHSQLHTTDLKQVKLAILASDGTISFIQK